MANETNVSCCCGGNVYEKDFSGKQERGMNERIRKLRKESTTTQPHIYMERAVLETEAYKMYEGTVSVPELRAWYSSISSPTRRSASARTSLSWARRATARSPLPHSRSCAAIRWKTCTP